MTASTAAINTPVRATWRISVGVKAVYLSIRRANQRLKAAKNPFLGGSRRRRSRAHKAGESVRALKAEITTDTAIVTENCWNSRPVMPPVNDTGMNTASRTTVVATMGEATFFMASSAAARGFIPLAILTCAASTTTMASSTTRPIASTSPSSEMMLIENPSSGKSAKAPTSDTGIATSGMTVARQS